MLFAQGLTNDGTTTSSTYGFEGKNPRQETRTHRTLRVLASEAKIPAPTATTEEKEVTDMRPEGEKIPIRELEGH